MKRDSSSERGQALILIALAIIGLIGLTALAVDGGNAYAERRRAQNAADASALAAALAKVRSGDELNAIRSEGLARAASNHYDDSDATEGTSSPTVNVEIYNPPISGPYNGQDQYIQVFITTTIKTYFGRVVGIREITNKVQAVAHAKPPVIGPMFNGNAIVSLSEDECQAVKYGGGADTIVVGGGIFVNSNCDTAFFNQSGAGSLTIPCLQVVGDSTPIDPDVIHIGPPYCYANDAQPLPPIVYPNPTCSGPASQDGDVLSPGTVSGNFPPKKDGVQAAHLQPGIYCVGGDFRMNANDVLSGSDVVIVMQTGGVNWNGDATINLSAPTSGPFDGLLLYMPESNDSAITINGDSNSSFTGSILAPSSGITINGTGGVEGLNGQIIGSTVFLSGASATNIYYNDDDNYDAPVNPQIELVQ